MELIVIGVIALLLLPPARWVVRRVVAKTLPGASSPGWLLYSLLLPPACVLEALVIVFAVSPFVHGNEGAGFTLAGSKILGGFWFLLTFACMLLLAPAAVLGGIGGILLWRRRPPRPAQPAVVDEAAAVEKLFNTAVKQEARGEYDKALALYREIIEKYPTSEWAKDSLTCMEILQKRRGL
ncbi:MAG: hypothetical protein PCFJNLEI_01311 [Verrucomicrobiae bacterium]|nr:hypothetical protein [Verrucomicrobiae bacterium]